MHIQRLLSASLPRGLSRRNFLSASAAVAAWPLLARETYGVVRRNVKLSGYPFTLGVASGDPAADGFVLWTRLAPQPLVADGGMPAVDLEVSWEVATDENMQQVVQRGTAVATSAAAHTVHIEVAGLKPAQQYFYRFGAAGETSTVGRTRTLPTRDATPNRLRFAFASCQHFESGMYPAYEYMVSEDLDLIFHLGDYIYEGKAGTKGVRQHIGPEIETLDQYRVRHAQYKTDPDLQAAHAACPWFVTWDDHEFDNNCAGDISEQPNVKAEDFLKRRANAYQAYYEHMPLRRSSIPQGPAMQLYRSASFGQLAEFCVLDTRQYRTDQPCGDGNKPPCDATYDPTATILGAAQEKWLLESLAKSPATWNVLAQQVMMGRIDRKPGAEVGYSMDQWPGYEVNRRRILRHFHDHKVANPVVLTGDIHANYVNNLLVDFDDLGGKVVGTEFVGTSISSGGNGVDKPAIHADIMSENAAFLKYWNAERGYVSCEVTPKQWVAHYRIATDVTKRHTPVVTRASFVTEAGRPGAELV
jgi:alkaline phosphatase D